jgi:hypothetical protein
MRLTRVIVAAVFSAQVACGSKHEGEKTGPTMRPGEDCRSCHGFSAAGTVFPAPDAAASGGLAGATVTVSDAAGRQVSLVSNSAGNFYTSASLTAPLSVQITSGGKTAKMQQAVGSGGCATCHSSPGAGGAPGRVYVSP